MKLFMFCLRLSHSGKAVHVAYANQTQESFLDGHVRAFEALGGVPIGMIRYDNLTPAVIRVALGRQRLENPRFVAMRSHYGFDSFFCIPGIEGAHERVAPREGSAGSGDDTSLRCHTWDRWPPSTTRLPPQITVMTPAGSVSARRPSALPRPGSWLLLRPLSGEVFDESARLSCRVDAKARVCVRQSYYSVPARFAGRRLEVRLGATEVIVTDAGTVVATHTRSLHKGSEDLVLDHYLEVLTRKPGALAGATALVAARACGAFSETHQRFWDAARRQLGDGPGTRVLVGVLLLHRTLPGPAVVAGIDAALILGSLDVDLVAVEARRSMLTQITPRPVALPPTAGVIAAIERPLPSLAGYDQLLKEATA